MATLLASAVSAVAGDSFAIWAPKMVITEDSIEKNQAFHYSKGANSQSILEAFNTAIRKYYPDIKKYSNLQNNIKEGISHLKKEYLKYGSYDLAIMTYNCGSPTNIGAISIQHLNNVLAFEKKLDEWFNYKYWNKINRYTN